MSEVTVVGEALVDVVARGTVSRVPGGGPMNVAVGLARLGHATRLVTCLGEDEDGASVRAHIEANGVDLDAVPIARTSTAVATIAADGSASYRFDLSWLPGRIEVPASTAVLHVGSIAAVLGPGAADVREIALRRPGDTLLTVDPNVRPTITPDRAAVLGWLEPLLDAADVVKLSDEDAAWLYPGDPVDRVLDRILDGPTRLAAVTTGGAGCVVATPSERIALPAAPASVVDTIGAGDSFMAGLVHALLVAGGTASSSAIGSFALACAAITVGRHGANPPTLAEVAS
ncbi:carbohydrate kinase [Curtobacterium sp. MCBD17_003]|uniref:carbohydrate kinase family protein n=1 Tax=Curtobacterium sp. MCBD17_003 TaxID=2175667 RepID=UPI000DA95D38|nr:carbohydrate kinase [Curtobacterium sp. MCBD17_003]WIE54004.1 carbohydrate kinase [Curtobacterium sp. MCBD17_003]